MCSWLGALVHTRLRQQCCRIVGLLLVVLLVVVVVMVNLCSGCGHGLSIGRKDLAWFVGLSLVVLLVVVVNLFVAIRADVAFAFLTDSRLAIPIGSTFRYRATVP